MLLIHPVPYLSDDKVHCTQIPLCNDTLMAGWSADVYSFVFDRKAGKRLQLTVS